jgi:hypothetical protein
MFTKAEARKALPGAACKLCVHLARVLPLWEEAAQDGTQRRCLRCGIIYSAASVVKAILSRRSHIRVGNRLWIAPAQVDLGTGESFSVNMSVIHSKQCPRCGTVKVGKWVSSTDDEPLPEPEPPPEHTEEECNLKLVDYVHDL